MNTMTTHPARQHLRQVSLRARPVAAAEARAQVRQAICTWEIPVDPAVAVLLTSELVTNAIKHSPGEVVILTITSTCDQFRVDVHDTSCSLPQTLTAPVDAEAGRGLLLVSSLSTSWGYHQTPAGKAVYFALDFPPRRARATAAARKGDRC